MAAADILITVVTVCFNSALTIRKTIESVLKQTYHYYEYIIVDGNSTDQTVQIAREYEDMFQGRLQIISEPDEGIYDAMNKGIRMAKGKIVGLINSNDYYEEDALKKITDAYTGADLEIVYGMEREFTKDGALRDIVFYHHAFLTERMINHPTCFVTKATYDTIGYFDIQYKASGDYDFMLKAFFSKRVTFTPVYEIIANFYFGGMSGKREAHLETFKILKKYGCITTKRFFLITWRTILKRWIG